jgi:nitrite reductase/ring-hydroxylating ferredoxin subunit
MSEGVRSSLSPDAAPALAALAALPDGVPAACETEVGGAPESLILLRRGDAVRGWLNVCPHAGRRLDWAPGKFLLSKTGQLVCAVHGASFELDAGECVAGPCRGQSLRAVAVRVDADGMVRLAAE